jgi:hypothetical protein
MGGQRCSPTRLVVAASVLAAILPMRAFADVFREKVADSLARPTNIVHAGDGSGRTFVTEQVGRIRVYHGWSGGSAFLDISSLVIPGIEGAEQGLLGLAFDPDYETNLLLCVLLDPLR